MTWLFPFFLAAGAAVIAPILLHLRRQPPQTRVSFSSLMFLQQTPVVTSTRRRFEQWLLLALRCLALLLLAAMFARPFVVSKDELPASSGSAVVILVDRSASMGQGKVWATAQAKALEWAAKFKPQDHVAMGTVDRVLTRALDFEELEKKSPGERKDLIANELQRLGCSDESTHLDSALRESVSWLAEATEDGHAMAQRRIILISDMQEGAHLDALRGFAWPDDVALTCEVLKADTTDNLSMSLVASQDDAPSPTLTASANTSTAATSAPGLRVRLANTRDSRTDAFSLSWLGKGQAPIASGQLPAGATRVLHLPKPDMPAADSQPILELTGDKVLFDNRLFIAPPQPRKVNAVGLTARPDLGDASSPMFYLARALQPSAQFQPTLNVVDGANAKPELFKSAQWLVVTAESAQPDALAAASRWIEQGGQALCSVGEKYDAKTLSALLGGDLSLTEASVKNYALLADIDAHHPQLRPFQDARLSDFSKIHVWHYRKVMGEAAKSLQGLKAEVIAKFDNGDPAWLSIPRGKGRVMLMLHGWHPHDSQLALSTKFVPLLFGLLAEAGVALDEPVQFLVGDVLPLPREGAVNVISPDGKSHSINEKETARVVVAEHPGIYQIQSGNEKRLCAVNLAPEESRLAPMDLGKLTELGVRLEDDSAPAKALVVNDKQRLANEALESQQQYWLIALALLLWVLGVETWLAGRKQRAAVA